MPLDEHDRRRLESEMNALSAKFAEFEVAANHLAVRNRCLKSTVGLGKVTGSNSYNPEMGKMPWEEFQENMAYYIDKPPTRSPSLKLNAVARYHLKSEIGDHGLSHHVLKFPETNNMIVTGTSDLAEQNLSHVTHILQSDELQAAFPDILPPPSNRMAYTSDEITLIHKSSSRFPTIADYGIDSDLTGKHTSVGGILWFDDPVTEKNSENADQRLKNWRKIAHDMSFIAIPGSLIWFTYTRYYLDDSYSYILDKEGEWYSCIEPGRINLGCFLVDDKGALLLDRDGREQALYPTRHCVKREDVNKPVYFKGQKIEDVILESLDAKKARLTKREWNSQMLNNPQPDEDIQFRPEYLDGHTLPVDGRGLISWLDDPKNLKQWFNSESSRAPYHIALFGDPSYNDKGENDFQVLGVALQDRYGIWYILEAHYKREGIKGLEAYLTQAYRWRDDRAYNIGLAAGIETHGQQKALVVISDRIARDLNCSPMRFHELRANSNINKFDKLRIGGLEPLFRGGKIYWCQNVDWFCKIAKREMPGYGAGATHDDIGDGLANLLQVFPPATHGRETAPIDLYPERENYDMFDDDADYIGDELEPELEMTA